jgi:hypothetical protein
MSAVLGLLYIYYSCPAVLDQLHKATVTACCTTSYNERLPKFADCIGPVHCSLPIVLGLLF